MPNRFRDLLKDEVVKPMIDQIAKTALGTIIEYEKRTNTATVNMADVLTGSPTVLFFVPVQIANGFNQCGPFPGQRVILTFTRGMANAPLITGVCDQRYEASTRGFFQTHRRQGGYLPDAICSR